MDNRRLERFLNKVSVEPNTGCWLWTASDNGGGYGKFWDVARTQYSHRASGLATGAKSRAKTHCPSGHEYSKSNTYSYPNGRSCKTCVLRRSKERAQK